MQCPLPSQEQLAEARQKLRQHRETYPERPIGEADVLRALDPDHEYFITTSLYWDCECDSGFIRSSEVKMCEQCGAFREDSPDSRIHEMKQLGIHLDYDDPAVMATFCEHR